MKSTFPGFDLDVALRAWRRSLEYNPAFSADDLDELEQHLRDEVAGLVAEGLDVEAAYRAALREMGDYGTAEGEYRKVYWGKRRRRGELLNELRWRAAMLKNYFKTAFRNLRRQKGYSFINVIGLTLGLTCCLLIFQYVAFEYSFDTFNENVSNLYRVTQTASQDGGASNASTLAGYALGPALLQEVPEIMHVTRLHPEYESAVVSNPSHPDRTFEESRVYYADPDFLQMFSYPLVEGDPARALAEPGAVLLSETAARRYFGSENPVGQPLDVTGWVSGTYRVAGVFHDVPVNSHLQFDLLLPMAALLQGSYQDPLDAWNWENFITYAQLHADAAPVAVAHKGTDVLRSHLAEAYGEPIQKHLSLQPLRDVHLNDDIAAPKAVMGSYRTVHFFTLIGLVTLLIALINYVNLATARALGRAREVGVRKVVGAQRRQLIAQFLCESAIANFIAVVLAVALSLIARPVVNRVTGTSLPDVPWESPAFWGVLLVAFCTATLLAGLYPALVLSSFRPVVVLKGAASSSATRTWSRRGLVVFQFAASIALLVGTGVVHRQLGFMRHMDLGIDLEQILTIPGPRALPDGTDRADAIATFTQELDRLPAVRQTATSSSVPGQGFVFATTLHKARGDASAEVTVSGTRIDTSFVSLYGLELIAGNGFNNITLSTSDAEQRPLLANETAIRAVGFDTPEEALGQEVGIGHIVGVIKDFNWSSAHQAREKAFFILSRGQRQVSVKVSTENLSQTMASVERIYKQHFPGNPFRYAFVDEQFDRQYKSDQHFATLFSFFAALALLIACLGLFGLASFTAQRRTKEVGVRKVLGASVTGLVWLLARDFLRLVGLAFLAAAPVAYLLMQRWLEGFAFHIDLSISTFVLAGLAALGIALLTVSYQAVNAALADPVKSLRYE